MTDRERADLLGAEREIRRLANQVAALERRLQAAEAATKAATMARDVAVRLAADPWRRRSHD